ncbi:MAG: hypothetical protein II744_05290, partial [Eubacterium sp.]|nr:hypothetical protein [Eubacterium sp.]
FSFTVTESKRTNKEKTRLAVLVSLLICVCVGAAFAVYISGSGSKEPTEYDSLDKAVEILDGEKEDIVLFTGFDYGQYMEFKGYHPYIDGRAELFLKDNNNEFDYLKEYYDMMRGKLDCKEFTEKYGFTHLIVNKNEPYLYKELLSDGDYELIYKDSYIYMFRQKSLDNAK